MFPLFSVGLVPMLRVGFRKGRSGSCPVLFCPWCCLAVRLLPCKGLDLTVSQGAPQYPPGASLLKLCAQSLCLSAEPWLRQRIEWSLVPSDCFTTLLRYN